jgi:uncharacterized protein
MIDESSGYHRGSIEPLSGPVHRADRIHALDTLRGVALFGVLTINLVYSFRVSLFEQFMPTSDAASWIDQVTDIFLFLAIQTKAKALFALLFGVGLAIQFDRLAATGRRLYLLTRRLAVLLAIGIAHLLLMWNGDILTEYALVGFVVLPFLFGQQRLLLWAAIAFFGLYLVSQILLPPESLYDSAWVSQHVLEARRTYGTGTFSEVLTFRIREISVMFPIYALSFPETVVEFLLGVLVWRSNILRASLENYQMLSGIAFVGIFVGIGLTLTEASLTVFGAASKPLYFLVRSLATVTLACGYGAFVIVMATRSRILAWASPMGRMAFTNYLAQSLILGWIFYGYGLGYFGQLGVATGFGIAIIIYAVQTAVSHWWLKHYCFGPIEWLWRSLMYGLPQPMRLT